MEFNIQTDEDGLITLGYWERDQDHRIGDPMTPGEVLELASLLHAAVNNPEEFR